MSYEMIALLIFASMLVMLLTGQRIFAAIGGVATISRCCCGEKVPRACRSTPALFC